MMTRILYVAILTMMIQLTYAQEHRCGTPLQDEAQTQRLKNNINNMQAANQRKMARFADLQLHLVADNDGSRLFPLVDALQAVCESNERYGEFEMYFVLKDDIREIRNTNLNSHSIVSQARTLMNSRKTDDALNLFLVDNAGDGVGGYYSPGLDITVVRKSSIFREQVTDHEFGHFFSLRHTHYGWEDEPYDVNIHGETVTIATVGSNQSSGATVEWMNGNCDTAGDLFCDTKPDYGFGQARGNCIFNDVVYDVNDDLIEGVFINNTMSYSNDCSDYDFSPMQQAAMQADFDSPGRAFLRNTTISQYTPVTEKPSISSPTFNETVEFYNSVNVEWNAVDFAKTYIVRVSGGDMYFTNETNFTITDLDPNSTYQVDIIPYNEFGSCIVSNSVLFNTDNNILSSTNEIEGVSSIELFPNPISANTSLNIALDSKVGKDLSLELVDINGRVIKSINNQSIVTGSNILNVDISDVEAGIYFVRLRDGNASFTDKLIVR